MQSRVCLAGKADNMAVESIMNYIQVSERMASSGQPRPDQFEEIAARGYQAVINLAMPDSEKAIPEEGGIVTALKMIYVHIPVPFEAPQMFHLKTFFRAMGALSHVKLWVHCALNYRVSAFLYLYYRLVLGTGRREAKGVMLSSWEPDAVWQAFMALSDTAHAPAFKRGRPAA